MLPARSDYEIHQLDEDQDIIDINELPAANATPHMGWLHTFIMVLAAVLLFVMAGAVVLLIGFGFIALHNQDRSTIERIDKLRKQVTLLESSVGVSSAGLDDSIMDMQSRLRDFEEWQDDRDRWMADADKKLKWAHPPARRQVRASSPVSQPAREHKLILSPPEKPMTQTAPRKDIGRKVSTVREATTDEGPLSPGEAKSLIFGDPTPSE